VRHDLIPPVERWIPARLPDWAVGVLFLVALYGLIGSVLFFAIRPVKILLGGGAE
jgi:hypothetical protein